MSFDERQPDANYRQMCVNLTAERDALKADQKQNGEDYCTLRDLCDAQFVQLTELREAAEAHVRVCPSLDGRTWLEDVLAKLPK